MINPKGKATEIYNKMFKVEDDMSNYPMCHDTAKKCALIAVDEIIKSEPLEPTTRDWNNYFEGTFARWHTEKTADSLDFWLEVEYELSKL